MSIVTNNKNPAIFFVQKCYKNVLQHVDSFLFERKFDPDPPTHQSMFVWYLVSFFHIFSKEKCNVMLIFHVDVSEC